LFQLIFLHDGVINRKKEKKPPPTYIPQKPNFQSFQNKSFKNPINQCLLVGHPQNLKTNIQHKIHGTSTCMNSNKPPPPPPPPKTQEKKNPPTQPALPTKKNIKIKKIKEKNPGSAL
jgi:hypothetical protein